MSKTSIILSILFTLALTAFMAPGIFALNRGKTLRNIALWLAIFFGLALVYQNFGPESDHPLFSGQAGLKWQRGAAPDTSDEKSGGGQGYTPPRE